MALDLALVRSALEMLKTWEGVNVLGHRSADGLRRLLIGQSQDLRSELAERAAVVRPIDDLDLIKYALNAMAEGPWSAAIEPGDRARFTGYLQSRRQMLAARRPAAAAPVISPPAAPPPAPVKTAPVAAPQILATPENLASPAPAIQPVPAPPPAPTPQPVAAPQVVAAPPVPAARPHPVAAPAPPRPPINWGKVWERSWQLVVSGALLRGLLYLGALMIVASAVVLVVRFWSNFSPLLQIAFVAAVPLSFYAGGFVLRRLKIPVAGTVFTGIGALLVAVDLAAVYQLGGLSRIIELPIYWLGASSVCAALYLFTLYRARGEFFGYLTLIGAGNAAVALAVALRLRPEWWVAAGALLRAAGAAGGRLPGRGGVAL